MPRSNGRPSSNGRPRTAIDHGEPVDPNDHNPSTTFIIIIVSLLFVAVFGGALVGGIVSGDPSNGFFITIIAASAVAIAVAATVTCRYYRNNKEAEEYIKQDIRGTFTRSGDEENGHDEEVEDYDRHHVYGHARTPVDARIKEVLPRSVAGDVSALSPHSYDIESYTTRDIGHNKRRERRGLFDFASVASSKRSFKSVRTPREDPPEESERYGPNTQRETSMEPSATYAATDGKIIEEDTSDVGLNTPSSLSRHTTASKYEIEANGSILSTTSRYEVEAESDIENPATSGKDTRDDVERTRSSSKSPASLRGQNNKNTSRAPKSKTNKSVTTRTPSAASKAPQTPAGSEAGSVASSIFFKQFNGFFSGKKKTASEAGYSEASSYVKGQGSDGATSGFVTNTTKAPDTKAPDNKSTISSSEGNAMEKRPPMPRKPGLETISGNNKEDRYAPSTPGRNSTVSMNSARAAPSPSGSAAPSEFKSTAGSSVFSAGVASSTFDPAAHERMLNRVRRTAAPLGASFGDMPIYYEEDENSMAPSAIQASVAPSAAESSVGVGAAYDVFAPSGPIGIVVDTKKNGCIVHSLKKTSPMQGLINPGDLIVALDDFDVRKLDAAALTKLMAKKSQQKERKFTLLPMNF